MECLFGIRGRDFCLLAADTVVVRSIVVMKGDEHANKFRVLGAGCAMAVSGEPGDGSNFADYVERNLVLYAIRNEGVSLDVRGAAAFTRKTLADSLRSRTPYNVNVLIGGVDQGTAKLFWMDYLGTLVEVPYGAHGYGAYFCSGLMDRYYKEGLSEAEAVELFKKCLTELRTRFVVNLPVFSVRIVRSSGEVVEQTITV